jgi:MFS transporter, ACS family, hexuronate transporter
MPLDPNSLNDASSSAGRLGKWWVCGLLLLALTLNYMDRQTLSLTIVSISEELGLSNTQYGTLERGFGYAFAIGGLGLGWLADKVSVRWLYPLILCAWSAAGVATGFADRIGQVLAPSVAAWWPGFVDPQDPSSCAFLGFLVCRTVLGFFEAGQWPCALITTQRLLEPADRPFGNGLLQSGASVGAILTPLVVQVLVTAQPGSWRGPYVVIGTLGLSWILPWTWLTRRVRLAAPPRGPAAVNAPRVDPGEGRRVSPWLLVRRCLALAIVVVAINQAWQFFRAWQPKMLEQYHHYDAATVRYFTSAYYIATDLGCILSGLAVKLLTARKLPLHAVRLAVFFVCAGLTALGAVASELGRGPLLLVLLLLIGFGSLGLFPNYYSLTQDISRRYQGRLTGIFGCITWVATAEMQLMVGQHLDRTHSYAAPMFWLGLAPAVAFLALCLLWGRDNHSQRNSDSRGP